MPIVKVKGGYKIRRKSGGLYPKKYKTKAAAKRRVKFLLELTAPKLIEAVNKILMGYFRKYN